MSELSIFWTLPACRDTAKLRLEHSSWFGSWWQQWHKCGEQQAENTASHRNSSLTEYDDPTWNTSQHRKVRVWALGIFWLAQLKHLQEHSVWAQAGAFLQCCPGQQCSVSSVNASQSTTDQLLPGFTGGICPRYSPQWSFCFSIRKRQG